MEVVFAFIDESTNHRLSTQLSSCTGLLVPAGSYDAIRLGVYHAVSKELQPVPRRFVPAPELHWRDFLPQATDERRLDVLEALVALANGQDISVVRVSYFVTNRLRKTFAGDRDLFGLCFFGLRAALAPLTLDKLVVPVVDAGFSESFQKTVRSYSGNKKTTEILRSAGIEPGIPGWNFANEAEVLYADSEFSAPLQLVDVYSGLRGLIDTRKVEPEQEFTELKEKMYSIAGKLDHAMLVDRIISITSNGSIEGPPEFAS